jgi:O-antigen/teichoic acid export membrane protein
LENFKGIAVASLMQAVMFVPLVVVYVKDETNLFAAALLWSGSFIVYSLVLMLLQKRIIGQLILPSFDYGKWKHNILSSYHFTLNGFLGMAYQFSPLFILSYFSSMENVGSFSLVYKLVFAVCGAAFYLPSVFYPRLSRNFKDDFNEFKIQQKRLVVVMMLIAATFLLVSYLGKDYVVNYFDESKYIGMSGLYSVLIWLVVGYLIRFSFNVPLLAMGKQKLITKQMSYAFIVVLLLGVPLIYYKGALGAAFTVIAGEAVVVVIAILGYMRCASYESELRRVI